MGLKRSAMIEGGWKCEMRFESLAGQSERYTCTSWPRRFWTTRGRLCGAWGPWWTSPTSDAWRTNSGACR
ncbi:hypothetical protein DFAR_3710009 [Desulfarculales bacterium]